MRRTGEGWCSFCEQYRIVHSAIEYKPSGSDKVLASICEQCVKLAQELLNQYLPTLS